MSRFSFYPVGDSYLLVTVVALALLALLFFTPVGRLDGRPRRAALIALRLGVIALVILTMLRPTWIYTEHKKQSATLVVLADSSRSMSVRDAVGDRTRWEMVQQALAEAQPALAELATDFELKAYTFDSALNPLDVDRGQIPLPEVPEGKQTAIGFALEEALRREAGKRLLGVILLSDGAQRAYAPRDMAPQIAAARMKPLGAPLFTVPLGQSHGLGQERDVAVTRLNVNQNVFVKNELPIGGEIRVDGFVNREIPVRVLFETAPGKMEVVAQENIAVTTDGQLSPVLLNYTPRVPGEYKLTLESVPQSGELVTTNNRLSTFVNVLKGGLNVLYLEGFPPRPEIAYLRRALGSSPDINVDYVSIDPRREETRPGDLAQRFRPGKYDVYILGDLDSSAFTPKELEDLAQTVDQGAGLIMLGGLHSFAPGGYATTPLGDVLPVTMDRFERQPLDEPIRTDLHHPGPLRIRPTKLGLLHFVLSLAGNRQDNTAIWSKLPPLEGANKFRRLAPGAVVLAEAGPDVPLLVAHNWGNGRVLAFAGDSTWRWWMHGFEEQHKRLWRQVILWLARKDQLADGNVWVRVPKRRFAPGDRVEFTVGARAPTGEPLLDATYQVEAVSPDGSRRPLRVVQQDEQSAGSFRDTQAAGDYAIEVSATHDGAPLGSARARFLVFQQDLELDNATADASAMESLSAMTGGQSVTPQELDELVERLATQTEHLEIEQQTKDSFWDTWWMFLVIVGLLGLEWFLRKRWGLV